MGNFHSSNTTDHQGLPFYWRDFLSLPGVAIRQEVEGNSKKWDTDGKKLSKDITGDAPK